MKRILLILFIALPNFLFSQNHDPIDSIMALLKADREDSTKVKHLIFLSVQYQDYNELDSALLIGNEALAIAQKVNYQYGVAMIYGNMGNVYEDKNDFKEAGIYFSKSLETGKQINNPKIISRCYGALGRVNEKQGEYAIALDHYLNALKIKTEIQDSSGMAIVYNNIGLLFEKQKNFKTAIEYHQLALAIREKIKDPKGIAASLNNFGNIYYYQSDYSKALVYYLQSVKIKEEINDKLGAAVTLANIGAIYSETDKPAEALKYYKRSLEIHIEYNDKTGIVLNYIHLADLAAFQKNFQEAARYFELGLLNAKEIDFKEAIKEACLGLAQCYSEKKNYQKAYQYHQLFSQYKDSLLNDQSSRQITEMQTKYETEKKELQIENLNKDNVIKETEIKKQNFQKLAFAAGFVLMVFLAFFIFRGYRQKQKANEIITQQKEEVEKQKKIVDEKNSSLETAYKNIEEKNNEILDSIRYAQRIQEAILPPRKLVKQHLDQSFILYKPKDIVAGDFYWMETIPGIVLFASVDCTGHGVPGAFMSILGFNGLNRCVKEFGLTQPAAILDKLCELVDEAFSKSEADIKDGMDIALCSFDYKNNTLEFSGAGNSLYFIRKNSLIEYKADKQPVGKFANRKPFTNHLIQAQQNDAIYIFTDGYADQFGGPKGKKFKYRQFEELLLSIQDKSMTEQREVLNNSIENWKGELEQIDDICIIGVRV